MKKLFILAGTAILFGSTALAAPRKSAYRYNYGMAGCGLGSLLVEGQERHNDKLFQVVAALVNNWFFPQTSAITSGTSNCTDTPSSVARMEQEVYLQANFSSLEKEAARGSGEHLVALADVMGCKPQEFAFASLSQQRYNAIFSDSNPKAVLDRYVSELKTHELLAASCSRIH